MTDEFTSSVCSQCAGWLLSFACVCLGYISGLKQGAAGRNWPFHKHFIICKNQKQFMVKI